MNKSCLWILFLSTTPTQLPDSPAGLKYAPDGYRAVASILDRGKLPTLPNGYRAAYDTRPDAYSQKYIPPIPYTTGFENRTILMAPPGHNMNGHDRLHIPDYERMLQSALVADTFQLAAANGLALLDERLRLEECRRFTGNVDRLADLMGIFYLGAVAARHVDEARRLLADLAQMAYGNSQNDLEKITASLLQESELDYFKSIAIPNRPFTVSDYASPTLVGSVVFDDRHFTPQPEERQRRLD